MRYLSIFLKTLSNDFWKVSNFFRLSKLSYMMGFMAFYSGVLWVCYTSLTELVALISFSFSSLPTMATGTVSRMLMIIVNFVLGLIPANFITILSALLSTELCLFLLKYREKVFNHITKV